MFFTQIPVIYRFRTVLWPGAVCRILRRAAIEADRKKSSVGLPSTPRKKKHGEDTDPERVCGTPSKMIAKHFSSLTLDSPNPHKPQQSDSSDQEGDEQGEPLITKIHSTRTHLSTDHTLEYRLEIAPAQLVRLVEDGVKGIRMPPEVDDVYASSESEDEDSDDGKGKGKGKEDPQSHMRLWMPACMVELVEPGLVAKFEEGARRRAEKKAGRGRGRGRGKANGRATEKEKGKKSVLPLFAASDNDVDEEGRDTLSTLPKGKERMKVNANKDKGKEKEKEKESTFPLLDQYDDEEAAWEQSGASAVSTMKPTQTKSNPPPNPKPKPFPLFHPSDHEETDWREGVPAPKDIPHKKQSEASMPPPPPPKPKARPKSRTVYIDVTDVSTDSDSVPQDLRGYFAAVAKPKSKPKSKPDVAPGPGLGPNTMGIREKPKPRPGSGTNQPIYPSLPFIPLTGRTTTAAELKARSKPKPIHHIPLYLSDSDSVSERDNDLFVSGAVAGGAASTTLKPFPMSLNDDNIGFEGMGAHAYDDGDPFLNVDFDRVLSPTAGSPKPKQGRKNPVSPSDSEREETRINKSLRKSKEHTSPQKKNKTSSLAERHLDPSSSPARERERKRQGDEEDWSLNVPARAGSPSPLHPRPKAKPQILRSQPQPKSKKLQPPMSNNTIIEISSGDDMPPSRSYKPMKAPLLIARDKYTREKTKIATTAKANSNTDTCSWSSDIIDLT